METGFVAWLFAAAVALHAVVIWAWWRHEAPPTLRVAVVGLFATNGLALALHTLSLLAPMAWAQRTMSIADLWSNPFLFWVAVAGLLSSRAAAVAVIPAFAVPLFLTPLVALGDPFGWAWTDAWLLLTEAPLLAAIVAAGIALFRGAREPPTDAEQRAALLAAGVLGLRFGELSASVFVPSFLRIPEYGLEFPMLRAGEAIAMFSLALGTGFSLAASFASGRAAARLPPLLVLVGVLLGIGRVSSGAAVAVWLSLMHVRPVLFLAILSEYRTGRLLPTRASEEWRVAFTTLGAFGLGMAAIVVAEALWSPSLPSQLAIGSGTGLLVVGALRHPPALSPRGPPEPAAPGPPEGARSFEVDLTSLVEHPRVPLPEGWQERLREGLRRYGQLTVEQRAGLVRLVRWQRLLIALATAPSADPARPAPFLVTTPGLHLVTHCPYALIGSEINRANDRSTSIASEYGFASPGERSGPLIESSWGRAEGLRSGRVKRYELTPLGRAVARRLTDGLGCGDTADLALVVGEGYGRVARAAPQDQR